VTAYSTIVCWLSLCLLPQIPPASGVSPADGNQVPPNLVLTYHKVHKQASKQAQVLTYHKQASKQARMPCLHTACCLLPSAAPFCSTPTTLFLPLQV
jgi:hypothetical protein